MESARDMVALSKNITEKVRSRKGEISDDEVNSLMASFFHFGFSCYWLGYLYIRIFFLV